MVFIFNLIGALLIAFSILIVALPFLGISITGAEEFVVVAALVTPLLGIAFFGLLCMAIAGVLSRLDRIINNTADVADALDEMKNR